MRRRPLLVLRILVLLALASPIAGMTHDAGLGGSLLDPSSASGSALSWLARSDRNGIDHPTLRPVNERARRSVEAAVLSALRLDTEGAPDGR